MTHDDGRMHDFDADGLTDLHNHLIPGVDDGARDAEESLRWLRLMWADGVTRLATSPHLFGWLTQEESGTFERRLRDLEQAFAELQSAVAGRDDVPALHFSQEILVPTPEVAQAVFGHPDVGVRGTRYALCEFGFDPEGDPCDVVAAVRAQGRTPIIAHPERYRRDGGRIPIEEMRRWKEAGALLQVNGGSLLGDYTKSIEHTAWRLIEEGLADLVSSDHHADSRPVSPRAVGRALARRGAGEQARLLLAENTGRVLDDRDLLPVPGLTARAA